MNRKRIDFAAKELVKASSDEPIFLSIDDTLSVKRTQSKSIEGLKFNHSWSSVNIVINLAPNLFVFFHTQLGRHFLKSCVSSLYCKTP